jgi:hypothetical protein
LHRKGTNGPLHYQEIDEKTKPSSRLGPGAMKRVELLRELVPTAGSIALLVNPANPAFANPEAEQVQEAARVLGLKLLVLNASTPSEIDAAFFNLRLEASTFPNQLASDQNGTITSLTADELHYEMTALAGGKISIVLRREALGCGRARDWNAVVPRAFSPHEL